MQPETPLEALSKPPLGLLCGDGWLPQELIRRLKSNTTPFFVLAFEGQTPDAMTEGCAHAWVRLGAAGKAIKTLRNAGCIDLIMIGSLARPPKSALRPDLWTAAFLARTSAYMKGDDGLLSALIDELETRQGFRVKDVKALMPDLIAEQKPLGEHDPTPEHQAAIRLAIQGARALGARDMGQACVADQRVIRAEEGKDGTAAMLSALTDMGGAPGGVLAKVLKPNQNTRVDRPAIGPDTVEQAARAGLSGIVVEAGGALILDQPAVIKIANAAGLFVIGLPVDDNQKNSEQLQ